MGGVCKVQRIVLNSVQFKHKTETANGSENAAVTKGFSHGSVSPDWVSYDRNVLSLCCYVESNRLANRG